ncbi:hypothetical protein C8R46DRAFT_1358284 [Mycena filopes]|nr:hypothetical protein C8R46DRAFT_1358284 [Mycena filopes]
MLLASIFAHPHTLRIIHFSDVIFSTKFTLHSTLAPLEALCAPSSVTLEEIRLRCFVRMQYPGPCITTEMQTLANNLEVLFDRVIHREDPGAHLGKFVPSFPSEPIPSRQFFGLCSMFAVSHGFFLDALWSRNWDSFPLTTMEAHPSEDEDRSPGPVEAPPVAVDIDRLISSFKSFFDELGVRVSKDLNGPLKAEVPVVDNTTNFWNAYKTVADEYDKEFQQKYSTDLDTTLIFAGLFSAVSSAFIIQIQPELQPDPSDMTQALLRVLIHNVNGSVFSGPDILLPHLSCTLLAALLAVLGKQWLMYYGAAGEKGSIEQRCLERQRKSEGMRRWAFNPIMQAFPLLLQFSLLLFAAALSVYLWTIHHSVAKIVLSLSAVGFGLYVFLGISSVWALQVSPALGLSTFDDLSRFLPQVQPNIVDSAMFADFLFYLNSTLDEPTTSEIASTDKSSHQGHLITSLFSRLATKMNLFYYQLSYDACETIARIVAITVTLANRDGVPHSNQSEEHGRLNAVHLFCSALARHHIHESVTTSALKLARCKLDIDQAITYGSHIATTPVDGFWAFRALCSFDKPPETFAADKEAALGDLLEAIAHLEARYYPPTPQSLHVLIMTLEYPNTQLSDAAFYIFYHARDNWLINRFELDTPHDSESLWCQLGSLALARPQRLGGLYMEMAATLSCHPQWKAAIALEIPA